MPKNKAENKIYTQQKSGELLNRTIIIDRIEGDIAVCEDVAASHVVDIPLDAIGFAVHEGMVLVQSNGIFKADCELEEKLRNENIAMQNSLFE